MLTAADAARRLSVSRATIYKLCEAGKLVHIRIGGAIRIPIDALDALFGQSTFE